MSAENRLKVFDHITDKAAEEYFETNTKDAQSVQQYAEGIGVKLSFDDAVRVGASAIMTRGFTQSLDYDVVRDALKVEEKKTVHVQLDKSLSEQLKSLIKMIVSTHAQQSSVLKNVEILFSEGDEIKVSGNAKASHGMLVLTWVTMTIEASEE